MSRRKRRDEHENHERWLVSYADLLTLMFAFFVVMYAISSINEGKFRVLASSLVTSFHAPNQSLDPIQVGDPTLSASLGIPGNAEGQVALTAPAEVQMESQRQAEQTLKENRKSAAAKTDLDAAAQKIKEAMAPLIEQGMVEVRHMKHWLEIDIKASILFDSGSAELSVQALPVLKQLAEIVRDLENPLEVEGHTDNVPIATTLFASNWELSGARSASVIRLFMEKGVEPERMVAIGFGEYRPIADNTSEHGRSRNRRVVVSILTQDRARRVATPPSHGTSPAEPSIDQAGKAHPGQAKALHALRPVESMLVNAQR